MTLLKTLLLLVLTVFLTACSTTQQAYVRNVQMYLEGNTGVSLSDEKIKNSSADLILVKNGSRAPVTMALAYIEGGLHKWVSSDNAMLIFQRGRLIRTLGLDSNLIFVSNLQYDPLILASSYERPVQWNRFIDTEYGDYGAQISSQTSISINQAVKIQSKAFITKKYVEEVQYQSELYGEHTWTNTFWFDQASGQLLKSSQKMSPQGDVIDITYLSRAIRLLES